jgi:hypothetical protein
VLVPLRPEPTTNTTLRWVVGSRTASIAVGPVELDMADSLTSVELV